MVWIVFAPLHAPQVTISCVPGSRQRRSCSHLGLRAAAQGAKVQTLCHCLLGRAELDVNINPHWRLQAVLVPVVAMIFVPAYQQNDM